MQRVSTAKSLFFATVFGAVIGAVLGAITPGEAAKIWAMSPATALTALIVVGPGFSAMRNLGYWTMVMAASGCAAILVSEVLNLPESIFNTWMAVFILNGGIFSAAIANRFFGRAITS